MEHLQNQKDHRRIKRKWRVKIVLHGLSLLGDWFEGYHTMENCKTQFLKQIKNILLLGDVYPKFILNE